MQKKQKIPFTMDMKGTPRFAKFAILSMLLLAATQAACQERIDEMRGCGNQTIVKCKDATVNIESDSFAGINIPVTNSCGNNK